MGMEDVAWQFLKETGWRLDDAPWWLKVPYFRRKLKRFYGNKCYYCTCAFTSGQKVTLDHKMPRSRGGTDDISNIVLACWPCNQDKGALTEFEYLSKKTASLCCLKEKTPPSS